MNRFWRREPSVKSAKNDLYLVTIRTPWSTYEDTIEANSLQHAAAAGVSRRFGSEVDSRAWIRRPGPVMGALRVLSMHSTHPTIRVTAEALTY